MYSSKVYSSKVYLSKVYFCEMYPTCVSSKLCEFIFHLILVLSYIVTPWASVLHYYETKTVQLILQRNISTCPLACTPTYPNKESLCHHIWSCDQKWPSGGRWYAPKWITPGISAWGHRSSISISINIRNIQQYIGINYNYKKMGPEMFLYLYWLKKHHLTHPHKPT